MKLTARLVAKGSQPDGLLIPEKAVVLKESMVLEVWLSEHGSNQKLPLPFL